MVVVARSIVTQPIMVTLLHHKAYYQQLRGELVEAGI